MSKVQLVIFLKAFFFECLKSPIIFISSSYTFYLTVDKKAYATSEGKYPQIPQRVTIYIFFIFLLSCVVLCILCILDLHQLSMYLLCTSIYFNTTNILILICFNKNWQTFKKFYFFGNDPISVFVVFLFYGVENLLIH